jgi:hypothetical protein
MNRAALIPDTVAAKSSSARPGSSVRVSHPGDSFELEADRVADTVSRGGRVSNWSLSASGFDGVYRQAAPPPPTPSLGDIAGHVADAILATPAGQQAVAAATANVSTRAGLVLTGSTAIGVVSALARAKKPLPAYARAIPLDFLHPGLSVKIDYQGAVNQPSAASITFTYAPKPADKKHAQTPTEKLSTGNAHIAAATATPVSAASAAAHKAAARTENKPAPNPTPDDKKKEEIPVQRKAEPSVPISTGSADIDSVLRSTGRPLDRSTRREMESRIGFDFSAVRLHTDSRAADSAQSLSARAYTVGNNVVFAPGRYAPHTAEGRHLLAHELTHVVQQTTSPQRTHPTVRPAPAHVQRAWNGANVPGASWVIEKIRGLKGYPLFCTIVGEDLFSGEKVERNATTLTQGVLGLFDGGPEIFEKLKKAGQALEAAYSWLLAELRKRRLTVEGFNELLDRAAQAVDLSHPFDSAERVLNILKEPLNSLIDLAGVVAKKVLDFILEGVIATFGETGKKIWAFFQRAGNVISRIAANPLQFGMNLLKAVGDGFKNFFANIWDHLSTGVKTWIYEELELPKDIKLPEEFTLGSMFKLLLQVLGLTWAYRRPQLVEKLQPIGGETVVHFFETLTDKAGDVIKRIKENGFSAIKDMVVEQAGEIFNSFVSNIKNWIAEEFIKRGLKLIAELSNPAGELLKIVESIIDTVTFVIDKAKQLAELGTTVVNALSDIVEGSTGPAAKKVEETLVKFIPLLLRFVAGQFGLSGIGKQIREIIHKIRQPIDNLIGRLLDGIVEKIKPLWEKGKRAFTEKMEAIKNWWTKPKKFSHAGENHDIVLSGDPNHPDITIHSTENPLGQYLEDVHAAPSQKAAIKAAAKLIKWTQGPAEKLSDDEQGNKNFENLRMLLDGLDNVKDRPNAEFKFYGTNAFGCGIKAEAFLSSNHRVGSKPESSDPQIMKLVRDGFPKDRYMKGHLLNMRLGGEGKWENMMPLTNRANQLMEGGVEGKLVSAISRGKKYYHYTVMTKYDETPLPIPATPQDAKSRLKQISWTVVPAKPDPANPKRLIEDTASPLTDENDHPLEMARTSVSPTIASGESES